MATPFFFFRPVLAADSSWVAFDWQSGERSTTYGADYIRCFSSAAVAPLANTMPLIISVSPDDLSNTEFIDTFEASQVVFVLPSSVLDDKKAMEHCHKLNGQGYRFGLDVDTTEILKKIPVADFDSVRFDAAFARQELSAFNLMYLDKAGFRKIATDVGTHEMFGWLQEKGFELYGSHFLTARNPAADKEPDLTRLKLLKLLNIVKQDGDTREIEAIFREEPKLSYNLLRLVNSVAVGARTKISSFSQAIAILGRRQLQRWLQLLIYANNLADGNTPNPLMQIAAARGRQMELLSTSITPEPDIPDLSDNAFMTGLFSLLDILINLPMSDILKELPMHDEVVEALLSPSSGGTLGALLAAVKSAEAGDFKAAESTYEKLGLDHWTVSRAQVAAFYWACRINVDKSHDD
jgi:EAL and modified HD-GYP domain-containing signal transduction protein